MLGALHKRMKIKGLTFFKGMGFFMQTLHIKAGVDIPVRGFHLSETTYFPQLDWTTK